MAASYTLDQGEEVIRRINRHWIDLFSLSFMAAVMIMLALVFSYGYGRFSNIFPSFIEGWMVAIVVGLFIIIAGLIMVIGTWVYRRNYVLITTKHIIQVEQRGLFNSQVDQVNLGRIQDVSGSRPGFVATMLDFGTVVVQSAGEARQFIMPHVPEPQPLADYILELHENYLEGNPGSGHE